jgi:hypothetical protein
MGLQVVLNLEKTETLAGKMLDLEAVPFRTLNVDKEYCAYSYPYAQLKLQERVYESWSAGLMLICFSYFLRAPV